jgi:hypothetical protein
MVADITGVMKKATIEGRLSFSKFNFYDESVGHNYLARGMEMILSAEDGRINLNYDTAYNGGTITGKIATNLSDEQPQITSSTVVKRISTTKEVKPLISRDFPGNDVTGYFNRNEDISYSLESMLANMIDYRYRLKPVGSATMVAEGGVLSGKAAPDFVTRIFPGLNLTKYKYTRLTGFTRFLADGSSENEMICTGLYDIYVRGKTDFERNARYTLGVIIPVPGVKVSAEWHHNWKQGRIPILKVQGVIANGRMENEKVSYPWPNETLFEMFLQNNIFYRAWVNKRSGSAGKAGSATK